jgi:hypothetical protein
MRIVKSSRFQILERSERALMGEDTINFAGLSYMFGPLRTQPTLRSRRVVVLQQAGRSRPEADTHRRSYSITSSATASSVGGTLRPTAFAVFRFRISPNFLGWSTGKSAGFSPFMIRLV